MRNKRQIYEVRAYYSTVEIDEDVCTGCNVCVDICPMDVFAPNQKKGKPPIVMYPDECQFCGECVEECPIAEKGAIRLRNPLPRRVSILRG